MKQKSSLSSNSSTGIYEISQPILCGSKLIVFVYKNSLFPGPNETHPQPPDSSVAILTLLAHLGMGLPSGLPRFISPSVTLYAFLVFSVFATVSIRVIVVHLSVALFGYHCK